MPASLGRRPCLLALLPRRAQDAFSRLLKSDEVMSRADHAARAAYEARAAASAPAADAIEEVVEPETTAAALADPVQQRQQGLRVLRRP